MATARQFQILVCVIIFAAIAGCTAKPYTVEPVTDFDVSRYTGTWYEIMRLDHRFERNLTNVTATYELLDDGGLLVTNRGFNRKSCKWKTVTGKAAFQQDTDVGSLSVRFFWPFAAGYHVFELDKEDYNWAVISGSNRRNLWILGREPTMPDALRQHLIRKARADGFATDKLIMVDQGPVSCR